MVAISAKRVRSRRRRSSSTTLSPSLVVGGASLLALSVLYALISLRPISPAGRLMRARRKPHVQHQTDESLNAIADDILSTLNCARLLNTTTVGGTTMTDAINEGSVDSEAMLDGNNSPLYDDLWDPSMSVSPTAAHLFCLAADATLPNAGLWQTRIACPATNAKQASLLELWSLARGELSDALLLAVLDLAVEHERTLAGQHVHLWAPSMDDGLEYMLGTLNNAELVADKGGIYGLDQNLGANKLFVDVGSSLGLTSMAVAILYPSTLIVSIEAASPSWLLQELNWRCNDLAATPTIVLSGIGPDHVGMAKMLWRPSSTTSTRSWTPAEERRATDIELTVKLRPWSSILADASILTSNIDVLNLDCEGCEYNVVPDLKEADYRAISTVIGGLHWGFIPESKLPSSQRAAATHERLCIHENIARDAKECCQFPHLQVVSAHPGEVLVSDTHHFPPRPSTVEDVAGALCDDFEQWAMDHHLYDVESDWGWFQITATASATT